MDWSRENLNSFEKNFYKASESSRKSGFIFKEFLLYFILISLIVTIFESSAHPDIDMTNKNGDQECRPKRG